jgi:hypothetical protein
MRMDGMEKLKRILENHKQKLKKPDVRYEPKDKHIRVTHDFNQGFIPNIKIRAHWELWLNWYYNIEQINFDTINSTDPNTGKPYLSRIPKKSLEALTKYAEQDPRGFIGDLFYCTQIALIENPSYLPRVEDRKPSEYDLTWHNKNKILNISIRLHDYLYEIRRQKEIDRPDYLKKFLKAYEIEEYNLLDIKDVVRRVMSDYYGADFKERFWQTFVTDRPVSIKQVRKIAPNPTPENDDFLKELFEEFM